MSSLVIATSNAHKTQKVRAMLPGFEISDLRDHPGLTLPEETGETFEANAIIKAAGGSAHLPGVLVLADDSGLEVDALGGAPGVRSARYSGEKATDASNGEKLKPELAKLPPQGACTGRFRCCMTLVRDGKTLHVAHGTVEGTLRLQEQGEGAALISGDSGQFRVGGHLIQPTEPREWVGRFQRTRVDWAIWLSKAASSTSFGSAGLIRRDSSTER